MRKNKNEELDIARSVIRSIPDSTLMDAKKFLDHLFDLKKVTKLYNTYIEGVETALQNTGNGRMYVKYDLAGAVTGRLSNSGYNISRGKDKESKLGVSFHTLPREQEEFNIREYVIAEPDHDFITVDMKAMELRVLAHVAKEKNMIRAFVEGKDLHDYTTGMVFNIKKEDTPKDVWKHKRQISKEVSFLVVYGGSEDTLSNKANIPLHSAKVIMDNWMETYPGVGRYMNTVEDYIKQFKYAKTIFGRRRNLLNIDSPIRWIREAAFRQGLNFTVQSPASDILLCGLIGIDKEFRKRNMKSRVVATVHDSIEAISPKKETKEAVEIMHDQLVNYPYLRKTFGINLDVPMEVEFEVGPSFGSGKKYELLLPSHGN
jgi:DNA polymerase I